MLRTMLMFRTMLPSAVTDNGAMTSRGDSAERVSSSRSEGDCGLKRSVRKLG